MPTWVYNIHVEIYKFDSHKRVKEWSICLLVKLQKNGELNKQELELLVAKEENPVNVKLEHNG